MAALGDPELAGGGLDSGGLDPRGEGWPQEVRRLLFDASQEAAELRAERRRLVGRVGELERELHAAAARLAAMSRQITTLEKERAARAAAARRPQQQQWLTDVADQAATALRSSQEQAIGVVERARQRAAELERAAQEEAAGIRRRAETEAAKLLNVAQFDAEGLLQGARESSEELLAQVRAKAETQMAELGRRRSALEAELARLEAHRVALLDTFAALRRPVDEAARLLEEGGRTRRPPFAGPIASRIRGAARSWGESAADPDADDGPRR